jgi:hypothetical protein
MSRPHTLLAIGLFQLGLLVSPRSTVAQVSSDTLPASGTDSERVTADSLRDPELRGDTSNAFKGVPTDSGRGAGRFDSTQDSLGAKTPNATLDSVSGRATGESVDSTSPRAPSDSILEAACSDPAGPASVGRDLLVVVFTPEAGKRERAAAAKTVAGKLLGPVSSEPGAYYLRVPADGQEFRLRAAADELAQLAQVQQVGSRACPPPSPSGKTGPSASS